MVANLGDSRAVACIHGAARPLTQVHNVDGDDGGDDDVDNRSLHTWSCKASYTGPSCRWWWCWWWWWWWWCWWLWWWWCWQRSVLSSSLGSLQGGYIQFSCLSDASIRLRPNEMKRDQTKGDNDITDVDCDGDRHDWWLKHWSCQRIKTWNFDFRHCDDYDILDEYWKSMITKPAHRSTIQVMIGVTWQYCHQFHHSKTYRRNFTIRMMMMIIRIKGQELSCLQDHNYPVYRTTTQAMLGNASVWQQWEGWSKTIGSGESLFPPGNHDHDHYHDEDDDDDHDDTEHEAEERVMCSDS